MNAAGPAELQMEDCQGLVKSLALQIHRRCGRAAELDDLVSDGQVGLAEAARDFDPSRNVKFSTFAYYRIRGAIYDGLARSGRLRPRAASEARFERMADRVLEEQSGSDAAERDPVAWLTSLTGTMAGVFLLSQPPRREGGPDFDAPDESLVPPDDVASDREIAALLRKLVEELPAELGILVRGVYFEGETLQSAGERVGVSKGWASRLHARALQMLARGLRSAGAAE